MYQAQTISSHAYHNQYGTQALIDSVGLKFISNSTVLEVLVSASEEYVYPAILQSRCINGMQVPASTEVTSEVPEVTSDGFQLELSNDGILIKVTNSSRSTVITANGLRFRIAQMLVDHAGPVPSRTLGTDPYLDLFVDGAAETSLAVRMYVQIDTFVCMHI